MTTTGDALLYLTCEARGHDPYDIDPTGGDPWMGGPVLITVCRRCQRELPHSDTAKAFNARDDREAQDAANKHIYLNEADGVGGYVCAVCEMPTETEPCAEHQPTAYAAMDLPLGADWLDVSEEGGAVYAIDPPTTDGLRDCGHPNHGSTDHDCAPFTVTTECACGRAEEHGPHDH